MAVKFKEYTGRTQRCDMYRCIKKAEYVLVGEDAPPGTKTLLCGSCAQSVAADVKELFFPHLVEPTPEPTVEPINETESEGIVPESEETENMEGTEPSEPTVEPIIENDETAPVEPTEETVEEAPQEPPAEEIPQEEVTEPPIEEPTEPISNFKKPSASKSKRR